MHNFLSNTRLIFGLLSLQVVLLFASIPSHGLHGDEAWLGEHAYFLAKDGYVHSNFMKGFNHQDEMLVVYHRLFIASESILIDLFGFGLSVLRILPIVCGVALGFTLWYFCRRRLGMTDAASALVLLIFLLIPQIFYFIKIARPEMMVTLFGFLSFTLLWERSWKYILVAGLCAGAAMMTHLNGAIFIGAGVIMLAVRRQFLQSIVFGFVAALVLTPYILDVIANFELFKLQLTNPYVASKSQVGILTPLINLSFEHQRLFRKPEIILPMSLFLLSLIVSWKHANAERKFVRLYTIVLMLLFGMLVEDKTVKYSACLAPFWAIVIVDALSSPLLRRALWKMTYAIMGLVFILFSLYYQALDIGNKETYVELNRKIGSHLPTGAWVVAPMNFLFNEVEHVKIISNELVRLETRNQPTSDNLAAFSDRKDVQYLIYNKYGERIDDMQDLAINRLHVLSLFDIVIENSDFTILRRRPSPQMH